MTLFFFSMSSCDKSRCEFFTNIIWSCTVCGNDMLLQISRVAIEFFAAVLALYAILYILDAFDMLPYRIGHVQYGGEGG